MPADLVSVVIPTFNRASLIGRAIASVLEQTHGATEIIVVDDGSTDNTADLIRDRYAAESRVRYLAQGNQGVSAARNHGFAVSHGDFIALLDSDDIWKPWKLELQIRCLRAVPEAAMIWTDMEALDADGSVLSRRYLRTMYRNSYRWFPDKSSLFSDSLPLVDICNIPGIAEAEDRLYWGDIFSQMIMGNLVHTSTVLLRRNRLEQVRGFNEELKGSGEDYDFHLRTCRAGPVAFADVSSIYYQVGRSDQLTQRPFRIYMARNFLNTITPVLETDGDRIRLPARMLRAVQAFANGWVGSENLELGETVQARTYMRRSLEFRFWQPKMWVLYSLTLLPPAAARIVLTCLRQVKHALLALSPFRG